MADSSALSSSSSSSRPTEVTEREDESTRSSVALWRLVVFFLQKGPQVYLVYFV